VPEKWGSLRRSNEIFLRAFQKMGNSPAIESQKWKRARNSRSTRRPLFEGGYHGRPVREA